LKVDVFFGSAEMTPADVSGRVVAVIDVLRASTTIAVALANGAKTIIPFESSEEVVTRSKSFDRSEVKLAGERKMRPVAGFDLGNSPGDFTREAVEGKTVLFSTTNGTGALTSINGARDVVVASYVNLSPIVAMLRSALRGGTDVTILCAGHDRHFSLEDAACAGRYARLITADHPTATLNDGAHSARLLDARYQDNLAAVFAESEHGRALAEVGFAADLAVAAAIDAYPVVPIYQDRQITKLGPDRER
jgi:2-phosphosulfolactate phosphatase